MNVKISGFYDEAHGELSKQLELIKRLGEKYLCPRNIDGRNVSSYTAEEFEKNVKPKLDEAGIYFSSIGSPIGKISITDEDGYVKQLKALEELIKIARLMGCKYIRIFSFFMPKGENPKSHRDAVMKKLKGFLKLAEGSGVMLLHENEKKIYGDTAARCMDIYNELKCPEFGLVYDASNFIQCGEDALEAYETVKEGVKYVHIKDCDAIYKVEVPVGMGDAHYTELFKRLKAANYDGFLTMEPHTFKYTLMRKPLRLIPGLKFVLKGYANVYRSLDEKLGKKLGDKISSEEIFLLQYENLKHLIAEAEL